MSKRNIRRWATNSIVRLSTPRRRKRPQENTEVLEDRIVLAAFSVEVDTLNDVVDENDGQFSLREAVALGEDLSPGGGGLARDALSIVFKDGLAGTIELNSPLVINSPGDVFISGPGPDLLTIDGNGGQVFRVDNGDAGLVRAGISGMTITGGGGNAGSAIDSNEDVTVSDVWVMNNDSANSGVLEHRGGTLVVTNSTFSGNTGAQGAGIHVLTGTAAVSNTTFSRNRATGSGGGLLSVGGVTTIRNSTFVENFSDSDDSGDEAGGGLAGNTGLITIHNTIVAGNGSGIATFVADDIFPGTLTSTSTFNFVGNANTPGGLTHGQNGNVLGINGSGIIDTRLVLDLSLEDNGGPTPTHALVPGSLAIDAGDNSQALDSDGGVLGSDQRGSARILDGDQDGTFTVDMGSHERGLRVNTDADTVTDISFDQLSLREAIEIASDTGERITFNPLMSGSTITLDGEELAISGNVTIAGLGADKLTIDADGGSRVFRALPGSFVVLSDLAITGGDASLSSDNDPSWDALGGGVLNDNAEVTIRNSRIYGNTAEWGGGINNWRGTLVVEGSTIDGNSATGNGGGVYNWGDGGSANAILVNTTLSANSAVNAGGALMNWPTSADLLLTNATVVGNTAAGTSSTFGAGVHTEGPATINNSLFVGNLRDGSPSDIGVTGGGTLVGANNMVGDPNTAGGLSHGTNGNILGDGSGSAVSAASVINVFLTDNGGPTPTHALAEGSPAIDRGNDANAKDANGDDLTTDQRLHPRKNGQVDIGAVEKPFAVMNDSATTTAGNAVSIDVLANDVAGENTEVRSTSGAPNGSVSGNGPVTYTPDGGFTGTDTFTYQIGLQADEHSNATEGSQEGFSVAIDGDWAIAGARRDSTFGFNNHGAAFIYRRNGATWEKFQELRPAELELRDRFGYSVAISGTTIVVGARLDDDSGFKSGSVYVFEYDASQTTWVQTQKLTNGTQRSQFGHAVDIEGDTLVVGARRDRAGSANSGAAYVFERGIRGFQETKFIKADDAAKADQFGSAVAISGDSIVVGAWKDNHANGGDELVDSGSVYVFDRDAGGNDNWGQVEKYIPSNRQQFDQFGFKVDIVGDTILAGSWVRSREDRTGAAYIFERGTGETKIFQNENATPTDGFGYSVALSGDNVLIGSRDDTAGGNNAGAVYLFNRFEGGNNNWGPVDSYLGGRNDSFGNSVAMDGFSLVIGANERGSEAGGVIFERRRFETATVTVEVNQNQLSGSGLGFGGSEITDEELAPIVDAARDYWRQQGLTAAQAAALNSAQVNVASLNGAVLGFESGGDVTIDSDAAGHGWYVDPTPQNLHDDHIGNRMDLLSNVTHELGHVIGHADRYDEASRDDVMHGFLSLGDRQLGSGSLDDVFANVGAELDSLF